MSVYKSKRSPFWAYDFQLDGVRFHGSTKAKGRRAAEEVERDLKAQARAARAAGKAAAAGPLAIGAAVARYWTEVGQHHAGAETTWTDLCRLVDYFGETRQLMTIGDDDVARIVAWRRGHTVRGRTVVRDPNDPKATRPAPLIAPATVNRSVLDPLQKLFTRARRIWRVPLPAEPDWRSHSLKEPIERVREIRPLEEDGLEAALRADYAPLVAFARAAGLRQAECLLRKDQVDLHAGRIETIGKGGKPIRQPITAEMRAILMSEMANPTPYVFTYAAARAKPGPNGWPKGARRPITAAGLKTLWRRARHRRTGPRLPPDLRFHDLRHDFATKLLRETGNLRLVQKALHHSRVETTTKYAHVLDEDLAAGMEAAARQRATKRGA